MTPHLVTATVREVALLMVLVVVCVGTEDKLNDRYVVQRPSARASRRKDEFTWYDKVSGELMIQQCYKNDTSGSLVSFSKLKDTSHGLISILITLKN